MGEAKKKRLSHKELLKQEPSCIYCGGDAECIDHMPPRALFLGRNRPDGLVFASCYACNHGTRSAEATAIAFSRISRTDSAFWDTQQGQGVLNTLRRDAPEVLKAFALLPKKDRWFENVRGEREASYEIRLDDPVIVTLLNRFCAKMAMALFREHVGKSLSEKGMVETYWFGNSGLSQSLAADLMSLLPSDGTLKQGRFHVREQFQYRFNCDSENIFAGLVSMHSNFHLYCIATSEPEKYGLPSSAKDQFSATQSHMKFGELLENRKN